MKYHRAVMQMKDPKQRSRHRPRTWIMDGAKSGLGRPYYYMAVNEKGSPYIGVRYSDSDIDRLIEVGTWEMVREGKMAILAKVAKLAKFTITADVMAEWLRYQSPLTQRVLAKATKRFLPDNQQVRK